MKKEKQHRVLRPTASTSRTEQWFKDRPEDLRRGEDGGGEKGKVQHSRRDRERSVLGVYW